VFVIFYFHLASKLGKILLYFFKMCETILGYWVGHHKSKVIKMCWHNLDKKDLVLFISNNQINITIGKLVYHKQFF
jgi:hypothetical protein